MKIMNARIPFFVVALGLVTLILVLQTGLSLYVSYYQLEKDLRKELFREEIADSMQFQNILEYLLQKKDMEQVQEEITVLGIEPAISKAVLVGESGVIQASTAYANRGKTFESLFPELAGSGYEALMDEARQVQQYRTLLLEEMGYWFLFQPVFFAPPEGISRDPRIGFLVIKVNLLWVAQQARQGLLDRFFPTLLSLVLGAVLLMVIAYLFHVRRLQALSQLVRDISIEGPGDRKSSTIGSDTGTGILQFLTNRSDKFIARKQQELTAAVEQIATREQWWSLMLDSIGDAVIATDTDQRIIRMNPVAEDLTAWNFSDAEGRTLNEILPVVDSATREPLTNPVAEVLSSGEIGKINSNTILLSKDGSEYHITDSAAPIKNEDGTIGGVILVFRDITETYHLQQKLYERNQQLEGVMDNMPTLLYIKDLEGRFVHVNRSFEEAYEFKNSELVGKTEHVLFDEETVNAYQKEDRRVVETAETIHFQSDADTRAGLRTYLTVKFPLRDLNDQVYSVCGMSTDITEQIHLIQQLEKSKNNLQAIIDHAPAVIYIRDLKGRFLLANKNLSELLQLPVDKIVGQNSYDIMDQDSADQHLIHEQQIIETGISQEYIEEYTIGGEVHHYLSVKYPLFDEDNQVYAVGGISTDITERFKLESSVRVSEQRMRLFRDQNPLAFIEWSPNLEVVDWNPAAEKLFGYSKGEAVGRSANELIVPEHLRNYVDKITEALNSQSGGEFSINENVTKAGKLIYCQWQNTPVTDESGVVVGIASLISDITEKQRIEEELKAQEIAQHQILNHIVDGVITIDDVGTVLSFNRSAEALFGYSADEMLGDNIARLMPEPHKPRHGSYIEHYLETGEANVIGFNQVVKAVRKNGEVFSMRLSVAELPVSTLGKRRFVGSCLDVTEVEQQQLQLQQIQKMEALGKLTGGIAHDYNNMLGVILGYVDLLESKVKEPGLFRYVEQIKKAGQRGASLTNKLLSFSRKKAIESDVVDINSLLLEEQDMLEKTLTPRIALTMELQNQLWSVWIDRGEFEDALLNLSINAMHAMEGSGELKLVTSNRTLDFGTAQELGVTEGEYVLVSISDNGAGMSESVRARIFDPFYTTKGEGGTGLGLSQVYGFVQRSNGAIWVSSTPSLGSRFELYFPRYTDVAADNAADENEHFSNLRGNESILIVDDEPAIREISRELLTAKGYKVYCAESGEQALDLLKDTPVDLMVSDVIMPGMDGYQLARQVKSLYPDLKIQLVSGFTGDYQPDDLNLNLQQQLLTKPVASEILLARIRRLLDEER